DLDDVRRMAAAGALGVEGVDGAALEGGDGVLDEAGFVQSVGVDHDLDIEVSPDISASSICCGQMKWMWLSKPPAVRIFPSPAMTSVPGPTTMVTSGWISGLPALPMAAIMPSLIATSALTMPQ